MRRCGGLPTMPSGNSPDDSSVAPPVDASLGVSVRSDDFAAQEGRIVQFRRVDRGIAEHEFDVVVDDLVGVDRESIDEPAPVLGRDDFGLFCLPARHQAVVPRLHVPVGLDRYVVGELEHENGLPRLLADGERGFDRRCRGLPLGAKGSKKAIYEARRSASRDDTSFDASMLRSSVWYRNDALFGKLADDHARGEMDEIVSFEREYDQGTLFTGKVQFKALEKLGIAVAGQTATHGAVKFSVLAEF